MVTENSRISSSAVSVGERRSGTSRAPNSTRKTVPTSATGRPIEVISNTPRGSPVSWSSRPETTRLVEVPSRVTTPPRRAANEIGIRNRDGEMPRLRHHVMTSGISMATSGVLGNTVDAAAVGTRRRAMAPVP